MRILRSLLATFVEVPDDLEEAAMWIGTPVAASLPLPAPGPGILVARVAKVLDGNRAEVDLGGGKGLVATAAGPGLRAGLLTACDVAGKRLLTRAAMGRATAEYGLVAYPDSVAPGTPCAELHAADHVWEIEVTANRGDLLSHYGFAREIAARTGRPLREPQARPAEGANPCARVRIDDPACGRYSGRVFEAVRVGPSPVRLADAVEALGARAISAPVDVTNFVLFELGHPLHVFDLDRLAGAEVVVRRARKGERLLALDGIEYALDPEDLVIADAEHPVALAGVMGGEASAVGETTRRILLEAARFDPREVRRSARRHRLATESSYRFERSVDLEGVGRAALRAAGLLLETCGGTAGPATDLAPGREAPRRVPFRPARIAEALGVTIPPAEIERLLASVGFRREGETVVVPSWRSDVAREADLVEETARLHGYDKIPETLPPLAHLPAAFDAGAPGTPRRRAALRARLRSLAAGRGYAECVSFSLEDPKALAAGGWPGPFPVLAKPLAENLSVLRPSLVPSLVRVAGHNAARGVAGGCLFEIGRAFLLDDGGHPVEEERLALLSWGETAPAGWWGPARAAEAHVLAADLAAILGALGLGIAPGDFDASGFARLGFASAQGDGAPVGGLLQLSEASCKPLSLEAHGGTAFRCVAAEVSVEAILAALPDDPARLPPPPRFPSSSRDLAFLFPEGASAGPLLAAAREAAGPHLESLVLFDAYRGDRIPKGTISYGFRLVFRSAERSLASEEVDAAARATAEVLTSRGGILRERA